MSPWEQVKLILPLILVNKDGNVVVEVYINDKLKSFRQSLLNIKKKSSTRSALGFNMTWDRLDGKKASRIKYYISGLNFDDHSNYDELAE